MDGKTPYDPRHEQFVTLFVRHQAAIHSFVLALVGDLNDAEDVVQEASLTMWRRFDQFQPGTNFRNWAFQVAKFTAKNHLTKVRRHRRHFSEKLVELLADQAVQRADDLAMQRNTLGHCIAKLSLDDQRTLAGCYSEGSSMKAFAQQTGRSANAVYKQVNRIRSALLECVKRTLAMEPST